MSNFLISSIGITAVIRFLLVIMLLSPVDKISFRAIYHSSSSNQVMTMA